MDKQVGDEFFTPLNISFDDRWRNAFILFSYIVFNVIVTIRESTCCCYFPAVFNVFPSFLSRIALPAVRKAVIGPCISFGGQHSSSPFREQLQCFARIF